MRAETSFAQASVFSNPLRTTHRRRGEIGKNATLDGRGFHICSPGTAAGKFCSASSQRSATGAVCLLAMRVRGLRRGGCRGSWGGRQGGCPCGLFSKGSAENVLRGRGAERDELSVSCLGFSPPRDAAGPGRGRLAWRGGAGIV